MKNVIKHKWPLMSAVSLFCASLALFFAVTFIPVQYKASTQLLITDASAATEEILDAVLASNMYQRVYDRKAPDELKSAKIDVKQKGVGPLFEISTAFPSEDHASRAIWQTASIIDDNSHTYFGAYSDTKVLNEPKVSLIPTPYTFLGYVGAGLAGGFALGLAISWVLTNSQKNGKFYGSPQKGQDLETEPNTPFETIPEPFTENMPPLIEDVPWVPETETVKPDEELEEGDDDVVIEPLGEPAKPENPEEEPVLEPIEPFSEPEIEQEPLEEVVVEEEINLDFGEYPTTKPIVDKQPAINTMFEHLPQA